MKYALIALTAASALSGACASRVHRRHNHDDLFKRYQDNASDACRCSTYVTTNVVAVTVYPEETPAPAPYQTSPAVEKPTGVPAYGSAPGTNDNTAVKPSASSVANDNTPVKPSDNTTTVKATDVQTDVAYVTPVKSSANDNTTTVKATDVQTDVAYVTPSSVAHVTPTVTVKPSVEVTPAPEVPHTPVGPAPTPEVTVAPTPGVYTIPAKTVTLTNTQTAIVEKTVTLTPGTQTYGGVTTVVVTPTTVTYPVATVETTEGVTVSKVYQTTYVCPSAGTYTVGASTSTVTNTVTVPCAVPTVYAPGTYTQPEVVTTITKTSQIITCPFEGTESTAAPSAPSSVKVVPTEAPAPSYTKETPKSSSVAPKPSSEAPKPSSVVPKPYSEVPKPSSEAPKPSSEVPKPSSEVSKPSSEAPKSSATPVASKTQASSSAAPSSTGGATLKPSGGLWSIAYSPYKNAGGCKTATEVAADISDIASKGFKNVRIYSTDCGGLENVANSCALHGMKMILGVFIKAGGVSTGDEQVKDIISWAKWELVETVIVGNEAVFNGYCSASELAAYIKDTKSKLKAAGYSGTVSTTETLNILQANGDALCDAMDYVGVNIQPFFDGGVTADKAGEFLASQLKDAEKVCGGKPGYVLEAGWPNGGSPNKAAIPGKAEQIKAIEGMEKTTPGRVSYFTYTNDLWKTPGAYGVETQFGCGTIF